MCGREVIRDEKCIFHLENKSEDEAKIFENEFWAEFERMEKNNDIKELHFDYFIFPNPITFFSNIFEKPIFFTGAQFRKKANFCESIFKNEADFSGAEFGKGAYFSEVKFSSEVYFSDTEFSDEVDFIRAEFIEKVDFYQAQFRNRAHFSEAKFNGKADFSWAEFGKGAYFSQAQFNNETKFYMSTFMGEVRFISTIFNNGSFINFEHSKFNKPKDVRFYNINLSCVSFLYVDISEVEFLNEKWETKNGRFIVVDESKSIENKSITYDAVAQLYRRLRRNYENNYRFAEAGGFFIGEMEMRRLDVTARFKNKYIRKIELWLKRNFSLIGIYKHLSLYGESYIRPVVWGLIVIILYPLVMHWLFNPTLTIQPIDFLNTNVRNSLASFFQMDNTYIMERIIGIPILGLLFIALKRNFERKR